MGRGFINKNNLHNRKKISCFFGDLWYLEYMKNEMNQKMNRKQFDAFGNERDWDLWDYEAHQKGYDDLGWGKNENPYEDGTLGHFLYNAGQYEYEMNG